MNDMSPNISRTATAVTIRGRSQAALFWSGLVPAVAAWVMMAAPAHALPIAIIDFNVSDPVAGTISYAGGSNPLVGSGISVSSVVALAANGTQMMATGTCIGCVLNFTTGYATPSSTWNFAAGGSFIITGGLDFNNDMIAGNDLNESPLGSTLFSGSFDTDGASVIKVDGSYNIAGGHVFGTYDADLVAFFGLPVDYGKGGFNIALRTSASPGSSFISSGLEGGDVMVDPPVSEPGTPVPEPGTLILLGSGLCGLFGLRAQRRRSVGVNG